MRCLSMSARSASLLALLLALGSTVPASANVKNSMLLSHSPSGEVANAPATHPVMSGDGRVARYVAYLSAATNIAGGKAVDNLFMVTRAKPYTTTGSRWNEGPTRLITKGANGDSWSPAFDGFDDVHGTTAPKCLAFVSKATNLGGGSSAAPDVFIKRLPNGAIKRLGGTSGASEVALDGQCREIAYVRNGRPYVAEVNGRGRPRAAGGSGARSLNLSANGETLTYERGGHVYVWTLGGRARDLGAGTQVTSEEWGRYVSFVRGGKIYKANLKGAVDAAPMPQQGGGTASGAMPSMSAGGDWSTYAVGPLVAITGYNKAKGACTPPSYSAEKLMRPLGVVLGELSDLGVALPSLPGLLARSAAIQLPDVLDPRPSAHTNYLVYSCAGGPAWLTWVGDQATGTTP